MKTRSKTTNFVFLQLMETGQAGLPGHPVQLHARKDFIHVLEPAQIRHQGEEEHHALESLQKLKSVGTDFVVKVSSPPRTNLLFSISF